MCGRYATTRSTADLAALLGASDATGGALTGPDYNVAPTKPVPAALVRDGQRQLVVLRWGLVPSWAKDPKIGARLINARAETITEKPAFRAAFRRRRCLLPADGYYEWQAGDGPKAPKQPYFLRPADGSLLALAGLYEIWHDAEHRAHWTTTVITTAAADDLGHIHDRTPMVLPPADWAAWLAPDTDDPQALLVPAVRGALSAVAVSTAVNDVRHNGPQLLTPLTEAADLLGRG